MIWASWQDFLAMGGYGLYVWGSVGVVFALIVAEVLALVARHRSALKAVSVTRQVRALDQAAKSRVASRALEGRP